ncbi:hypothetical protein L7F22_054560 [Adiantum nelumboides]|nr:hypothetical protein [Adiantum nelumboides]
MMLGRMVLRLFLVSNHINIFCLCPTFVFRWKADFSANFLREIPPSLGQITKLKVLNLDHNALKTFPNEVLKGCLELATLSLHGNELTVEYLRQLEGWAEFDIRRRAKHSKQLQFSILDTSGGFDEGADSQQWHHW